MIIIKQLIVQEKKVNIMLKSLFLFYYHLAFKLSCLQQINLVLFIKGLIIEYLCLLNWRQQFQAEYLRIKITLQSQSDCDLYLSECQFYKSYCNTKTTLCNSYAITSTIADKIAFLRILKIHQINIVDMQVKLLLILLIDIGYLLLSKKILRWICLYLCQQNLLFINICTFLLYICHSINEIFLQLFIFGYMLFEFEFKYL
ncbi:unnamed protein product [Paramecium sonneborni]|uniref:Transmembrane protein n=1 Tax=Paramecium sonneborni TaxID=65129 RepID=A0A8S1RMG0_9CILI|nr:unnamed protein product [Paramecium sonneborni]